MTNALFDVNGSGTRLLYSERPEKESDPIANRDRFIELLRERIASRHQNIVIIDASDTGEGKSTLGIQLARGVYPAWSIADTAYSSADALALYLQYEKDFTKAFEAHEPLPSRALLWDEGVLGLLSQGGRRNEELERTVQTLSIIRVIGVSVFLCIPRIRMLDAFVREGLAEYWLMVQERGRARLHRHFLGAMYKRPDRLPYDEMEWLYPVGFENMDELTMTPAELEARPEDAAMFRAYEKRKLRAIHDFLEDRPDAQKSKVATCERCGLVSSKYNVETHKCKGTPKGESPARAPA
jgi:hypothetical protein